MIRLIFLLLLASINITAFGQNAKCECIDNLNKTIAGTEKNYAGYPAKVNQSNAKEYEVLVRESKLKASGETDAKKCYYIIASYVKYFKDKHFIITYKNDKDFDSTVVNYLKNDANRSKFVKNSVEGIWINSDSTTKITIKKLKNNVYQAYKVESKVDNFPKGFVYFTLTSKNNRLIAKEYNSFMSTPVPAKQYGNLLQIWSYSIWGRIQPQPMSTAEAAELATWKNRHNGLAFRKISPNVAYLKVPTFLNNDNRIQKLVDLNDSIIRNTKYLVVDLRGNGGGNTGWTYFIKYFMTNPIIQKSSYLRVTPDNVKIELPALETFALNPISEEYKKYFPDSTLNAYKKAYQELPTTKAAFYPIPAVTFPLDSVTNNPKKIALLVDELCGSATEFFLFLSRQSKKTISYGTNTLGMMDYVGMSVPTPLPCEKFILKIPSEKSSWTDKNPIDQTGFTPDVVLNLPQDEWINFIMNDLKTK